MDHGPSSMVSFLRNQEVKVRYLEKMNARNADYVRVFDETVWHLREAGYLDQVLYLTNPVTYVGNLADRIWECRVKVTMSEATREFSEIFS